MMRTDHVTSSQHITINEKAYQALPPDVQKILVGLEVECLLSGPLGGDLQIGARLAQGEVDAVIFLRDPMTPQPHEPDINALVRACDVHNVPCATNLSSANHLLAALAR